MDNERKVKEKSPDGRFLKYDLKIGKGSFKTVSKGRDTLMNRDVAWCKIKVSGLDQYWQKRLKDEISIQKKLDHPHILPLYASWECQPEGNVILITELMTGGSLKPDGSKEKRPQKCNPIVIRNWGRQILKGLDYLHTQESPIIHRDLKCDNIFVDKRSGLIKIGDLGLAILKNKSYVKSIVGTPEFKAPEMYEEHYNELVDVYAFGMCLLEMETGEYPYRECENSVQIWKKVTKCVPPKSLENVKHSNLKNIIQRCTAFDVKDRCNVQDLLTDTFFAESTFTVDVIESDHETVKLELKGSRKIIQFSYLFNYHTPTSVVKELIQFGELGTDDDEHAVCAVEEKVEVLLLMRGTNDESDGMEIGTDSMTSVTQTVNPEKQEPRRKFIVTDTTTPTSVLPDTSNNVANPSINDSFHTAVLMSNTPPASLNPHQSDNDQEGIRSDYIKPINKSNSVCSDNVKELKPIPTTNELLFRFDKLKNSEKLEEKTNERYVCWSENQAKITHVVESNHQPIATALHAKDYIGLELYHKIVSPNVGSSGADRTRCMFAIIEEKLMHEEEIISTKTWDGLINTLKETQFKRLAMILEKKAHEMKNKLLAFQSTQVQLVSLVQASLHTFAVNAWSKGILNDVEMNQVTDPNFKCQEFFVSEMLTAVSNQIKDDPAVFDEVVKIFKKIGGPLKKVTEKYLTI